MLVEVCFENRTTKGFRFRRQRPVLNYIADFMCMELMLIIEVDGITHHSGEAIKKDELRQGILESAGFTVLRFSDEEVLNRIDSVRHYLEHWVEMKINGRINPPPTGAITTS